MEIYLIIGLGFAVIACCAAIILGLNPALLKSKKGKGRKKM